MMGVIRDKSYQDNALSYEALAEAGRRCPQFRTPPQSDVGHTKSNLTAEQRERWIGLI